MRKIIILMLCFLFVSCSLFKNTSKESLTIKSGVELNERKQIDLEYQDLTNTVNVNTRLQDEVNINGYTVKANTIKVYPDGLIEATGGVDIRGYNYNNNKLKDSTNTITNNNIKADINTDSITNRKESESIKETKKESKPSTKGLIIGTICTILFVLIFLTYFKK